MVKNRHSNRHLHKVKFYCKTVSTDICEAISNEMLFDIFSKTVIFRNSLKIGRMFCVRKLTGLMGVVNWYKMGEEE